MDYTPRTWGQGELVTAALLNAEIRDPFVALQAAWTGYLPAWSSTGSPPHVGDGSLVGSFLQVGHAVDVKILFTFGSTSRAGSGGYRFSLPLPAKDSLEGFPLGAGVLTDASAGRAYRRDTVWASGQTVRLVDRAFVSVGPGEPFRWSVGDSLWIVGRYESA